MTPTHIQLCRCYSLDSHTSEYCFSPLFQVSSVVSENVVPQMRMQSIKEINCIFRPTRITSIPVLKHTASWLTLTCILWVFGTNLDRKQSTVTDCSYFALVSFSKCHGNRINQATITSSHILDAYRSSVNLINDFVPNIKCRDYCPMNTKLIQILINIFKALELTAGIQGRILEHQSESSAKPEALIHHSLYCKVYQSLSFREFVFVDIYKLSLG
jgi:hypothetical protein